MPFLGLTLGLVLIALLSLIGAGGWLHVVYVLLLLIGMMSALLFSASNYGHDLGFDDFMATVSIGCGVALAIAIGLGEYSWGRLASRAGPTYWGMVAVMCFSFAISVRSIWLRAALMLTAVTTLVLASARGAMIATAVAGVAAAAAGGRLSSRLAARHLRPAPRHRLGRDRAVDRLGSGVARFPGSSADRRGLSPPRAVHHRRHLGA